MTAGLEARLGDRIKESCADAACLTGHAAGLLLKLNIGLDGRTLQDR